MNRVLHSIAMSNVNVAGGLKRDAGRLSRSRSNETSSVFVQLSRLRKVRACEQVAAVCYRLRHDEIEFLLVRTRGSGRWTFPKGSAEPGLTHAQAAALEAFEEAGVHGRIEEASFARYACRKRGEVRKSSTRCAEKLLQVNAHLCLVLRLSKPKESNRDRTWFPATEARRRLREGRESDEKAEFARVVDKAVARIQRSRSRTLVDSGYSQQDRHSDALQKVQFEAVAAGPHVGSRLNQARRYSIAAGDARGRSVLQGEILPFDAAPEVDRSPKWFPGKKIKALGTGSTNR